MIIKPHIWKKKNYNFFHTLKFTTKKAKIADLTFFVLGKIITCNFLLKIATKKSQNRWFVCIKPQNWEQKHIEQWLEIKMNLEFRGSDERGRIGVGGAEDGDRTGGWAGGESLAGVVPRRTRCSLLELH